MAEPAPRNSLEQSVLSAFPWLLAGLVVAIPLLLVPGSDDRRWDLIIHLVVLVGFLFALTLRLAPLVDAPWFVSQSWSPGRRHLVTAICLIVIVTGVTALVTLASSAALRFAPSLQFLQVLSALDIAWVVAGTTLAVRSLWGNGPAFLAGAMMSVVCVTSIALYLAEVGLDDRGGWLVDSGQLLRLVIPFDVAAAVMTVGLTILAASRAPRDDR